jgi:hypothetical protein
LGGGDGGQGSDGKSEKVELHLDGLSVCLEEVGVVELVVRRRRKIEACVGTNVSSSGQKSVI